MKKLMDGNSYNVNLPTYYVESVDELNDIPANEPEGTIAEVLTTDGLKVYMKRTSGWVEL